MVLAALILLKVEYVSAETNDVDVTIYGTQDYDEVNEVLKNVNEVRATYGLAPLVMDDTLVDYAMQRAAELAVYCKSSRPNGASYVTIMQDEFSSGYLGQIISVGCSDASEVVEEWLKSDVSKTSILSDKFTSTGIGCFYQDNGNLCWVELFSSVSSAGNYNKSGTETVENIPVTISYDNIDIDGFDRISEIDVYEGATRPLVLQLNNVAWSYATPVKLSGGYELVCDDVDKILVNTDDLTVTGVSSGTANIKVQLENGQIVENIQATVWAKPVLSYNINSDGQAEISWKDESGKACLFGKAAEEKEWQLLVDSGSGSNCYNSQTAVNGTYAYVLCMNTYGDRYVPITEPVVIGKLDTPVISSLESTESGIKITWEPVEGAKKYGILLKCGEEWKKICETSQTTINYNEVEADKAYTFSVCCINEAGDVYISDYDVDGQEITFVKYGYTGMIKNEHGWCYLTNGELDLNYTGMAKNAHGWWYIKNGKLDRSYTGMAKNSHGWWYMKDGKLDRTYTGLATNAHGTWYMKNGKLDKTFTGMVKVNSQWIYIKNGKFDTTYTGMAKNAHGWWYMTNGRLDRSYTGMAKNAHGWWYITNGRLDRSYTGMAKNSHGWWYIKDGKLDLTFTGIAENSKGQWYMQNGKLDKTYTGNIKYNEQQYNIVNGKVK